MANATDETSQTKPKTKMQADTKDTDKNRMEQAIAYYLDQGETPCSAREMAMDQLDWEDSHGEENRWKGPNDSEPLHSY